MSLTKVRDELEEARAFRWTNVGKLFVWVVVLFLVIALLDLVDMWFIVWTTPPQETMPGG